jgi:hypothetical protein
MQVQDGLVGMEWSDRSLQESGSNLPSDYPPEIAWKSFELHWVSITKL